WVDLPRLHRRPGQGSDVPRPCNNRSRSDVKGGMRAGILGAGELLRLVQQRVDVGSIHAQAKSPFKFFLCGDPALVAEMRATLFAGYGDDAAALDAAATRETIVPGRPTVVTEEAKAVVCLGRPGDRAGADFTSLLALKL